MTSGLQENKRSPGRVAVLNNNSDSNITKSLIKWIPKNQRFQQVKTFYAARNLGIHVGNVVRTRGSM